MVILQVHHLDGNYENNALENLQARCAKHHGKGNILNGTVRRGKRGTFVKVEKPVATTESSQTPVKKKSDKKNVKKSKKIRHRGATTESSQTDLSKKLKTRVFLQEKINKKINKNERKNDNVVHRGATTESSQTDLSKKTKSAKKREKTEEEQAGLTTKLSLSNILKKIATLESDLKQERKERKQERKRYQAKENEYAAERRERALDNGEEDDEPKKETRGRKGKQNNFPYYQPYEPVQNLIFYKSNGKAFAPDGHELTKEEESKIIDEILERGQQNIVRNR